MGAVTTPDTRAQVVVDTSSRTKASPITTEPDAIEHLSHSLPALDLDDNVLAAGAALPPNWRARAQQEGVGRRLDATTNPDDDNCIGSLEGGVSGIFEPCEMSSVALNNLTSNSCSVSRSSRRSRKSYSISNSPSPSGRHHLSRSGAPSVSLLASACRLAGGHAWKTARLRWCSRPRHPFRCVC